MRRRDWLVVPLAVGPVLAGPVLFGSSACGGDGCLYSSHVDRATPVEQPPMTTVYVVRHAEKLLGTGTRDPELSPAGKARALELPKVLPLTELDAIYATQYRRTRETVEPVAALTGLEIRGYRAGNIRGLAEHLREKHEGDHVLVAGHYDTVPRLIHELGVDVRVRLTEANYGDVFIVQFRGGEARLSRERFGGL